ncbi:transporter substrate-binding domain-containing protein [Streptococcus pluranimalium]|uniref:transporter substrate-binding domain-containing protein n=1 Tax=Streptococcus hyovaginalis TaxID=149015 RepID=UPI00147862B8|nr:transporter substrate-binding domain-containing protein [Streptococcus hyovaginalis]MDY3025228.1 transporter substrate-binding domain-containing protein [Streptococcus hyovaginalis]MDY5974233.1 transporter substrate-binding domain-containing protein [Streptococcus hyovaginalis]
MRLKKLLVLITSLVLVLSASSVYADQKKTIVVPTDSDTKPFTYKENGKFKGYDIDVVKAIFKDSKRYKVTFKTVPFSSILTGVDAGRYQLAANDFNYNEERAEKYLFSEPISKSNYAIAAKKGTSFDSLEAVSGKSVEVYSGSNYAQILEDWNEKHSDKKPIAIRYVANTVTLPQRLQNIENGKVDFLIYDAISLKTVIADQGLSLDVTDVEDKLGTDKDGLEYLLLPKDEEGEALQTYVNKRIKTLQENGTLSKLSQKHFGGDFSTTSDKQ